MTCPDDHVMSLGQGMADPRTSPTQVTEILGVPVERDLRAVPGKVDILDVFRRPSDIDAHVDDIIAMHPDVVWLQTGVRWGQGG